MFPGTVKDLNSFGAGRAEQHTGDGPASAGKYACWFETNTAWGAPRIHGELLKLGIEISERTISRLIKRYCPKSPSQTWKTFIKNHMHNTASIDFFTIPTITFKILYVMIILSHDCRRMLHFNVTRHPTAHWASRQAIEAFPYDTAPKYIVRDRDGIYGSLFSDRIKSMGIDEIITSYKSPWQNGYCERLIGSTRRECLDHVIVLGKNHLRRVLREYFSYYNNDRTHLGLKKGSVKNLSLFFWQRPSWSSASRILSQPVFQFLLKK